MVLYQDCLNYDPEFNIFVDKIKKCNKGECHTMKRDEAVNVHLPEEQKVTKLEENVKKSVDSESEGKDDNRHKADNGMEMDSDVSDGEADGPRYRFILPYNNKINLPQMDLELSEQKYEKSLLMKVDSVNRVENIVAKCKIAHYEEFLHLLLSF